MGEVHYEVTLAGLHQLEHWIPGHMWFRELDRYCDNGYGGAAEGHM